MAKEMATVSGAPMRAVSFVVTRPVELTVAKTAPCFMEYTVQGRRVTSRVLPSDMAAKAVI